MPDLLQQAILLACRVLEPVLDKECIVLSWTGKDSMLDSSVFDFPMDILKRVRVMTCSSPSDVIELMHILNNRNIERIIVLPGNSKLASALFEEFCDILKIPLSEIRNE